MMNQTNEDNLQGNFTLKPINPAAKEDINIIQVKLTEAALDAIEAHQKRGLAGGKICPKISLPINLSTGEGTITIPDQSQNPKLFKYKLDPLFDGNNLSSSNNKPVLWTLLLHRKQPTHLKMLGEMKTKMSIKADEDSSKTIFKKKHNQIVDWEKSNVTKALKPETKKLNLIEKKLDRNSFTSHSRPNSRGISLTNKNMNRVPTPTDLDRNLLHTHNRHNGRGISINNKELNRVPTPTIGLQQGINNQISTEEIKKYIIHILALKNIKNMRNLSIELNQRLQRSNNPNKTNVQTDLTLILQDIAQTKQSTGEIILLNKCYDFVDPNWENYTNIEKMEIKKKIAEKYAERSGKNHINSNFNFQNDSTSNKRRSLNTEKSALNLNPKRQKIENNSFTSKIPQKVEKAENITKLNSSFQGDFGARNRANFKNISKYNPGNSKKKDLDEIFKKDFSKIGTKREIVKELNINNVNSGVSNKKIDQSNPTEPNTLNSEPNEKNLNSQNEFYDKYSENPDDLFKHLEKFQKDAETIAKKEYTVELVNSNKRKYLLEFEKLEKEYNKLHKIFSNIKQKQSEIEDKKIFKEYKSMLKDNFVENHRRCSTILASLSVLQEIFSMSA